MAGAEELPTTRASARVPTWHNWPSWASRAAIRPFCFEITWGEIKEARDSSDSGLLPVSLKNV